MTAKNAKTLIALTVMIGVITALSSVQDAFANTEPWHWTSADQHYNCTSSVTTITKTLNVNPCGDLNSSSNVWEGFSGSSWDLDPSSSGTQYMHGPHFQQELVGKLRLDTTQTQVRHITHGL